MSKLVELTPYSGPALGNHIPCLLLLSENIWEKVGAV